jgi:hypothetical protein
MTMTEDNSHPNAPTNDQHQVAVYHHTIAIDSVETEPIPELLSRARRSLESSETSLRAAAEDIARAYEQGATQRGSPKAAQDRFLRDVLLAELGPQAVSLLPSGDGSER